MSLKSRNKIEVAFNMASLTDIIFLLLIFFMLTSTLVSPNALKLLLPSSDSQTLAKQTITISITEELAYYVDREEVSFDALAQTLAQRTAGEDDPTLVLNAEKSVPIENVVQIMDIANKMHLKMILATKPK
jgi:biopolymer transport protein ExbD